MLFRSQATAWLMRVTLCRMRPWWLSRWGMALSLCFVLIGLFAIGRGDWQGAGLALGLAAWRLFIDWMQGTDGFRSRCEIDQFRIDGNPEAATRGPRKRFGPVLVAVVLGWTIAVVVIGDVVLRVPSWAVTIGIVAVIPVSLLVAVASVYRLPPSLR